MIDFDSWEEMFQAMCSATQTRDYGGLCKTYYRAFAEMNPQPTDVELINVYTGLIAEIGAKLPNIAEIKRAIRAYRARNTPQLPQSKKRGTFIPRLYQAVVFYLKRGETEYLDRFCKDGKVLGAQVFRDKPITLDQVKAVATELTEWFGGDAIATEFSQKRDSNERILPAYQQVGNRQIYDALQQIVQQHLQGGL